MIETIEYGTDEWDALAPLLALDYQVRGALGRRADAVMLPLSLVPEMTQFYGLPVVRGDRIALIFEAR